MRGRGARRSKVLRVGIGVLILLLLVGFWLISYVNPLSFEWHQPSVVKWLALDYGRMSFSYQAEGGGLPNLEDFHPTAKELPDISIDGEYRQPRNAIQFLGAALFSWSHGKEAAWIVLIPCWMPVAILGGVAFFVLARRLYRRRRYKPGLCRKCGYDLRASPERCPECGTEIADPKPKASFMTRPRIVLAAAVMITCVATAGVLVYEHSFIPQPPERPANPMWDPVYQRKDQKIHDLLQSAPTSQPSPADVTEILDEIAHDSNWEIRFKAIDLLPFLHDREKAIDVLIGCVRERDPIATGSGLVPTAASRTLAGMKAVRAIPDVTNWLNYLQSDHPYGMMPGLLFQAKRDLSHLKAASTQPTTR
jgi:hypothetical protein